MKCLYCGDYKYDADIMSPSYLTPCPHCADHKPNKHDDKHRKRVKSITAKVDELITMLIKGD